MMMHARRTTIAFGLLCLALLLLAPDVHSRKLSWAVQEKQSHGHDTTAPEPCSGKGGSSAGAASSKGRLQRDDPAKWEEIHTDYIYTQDVKHP